MTVARSADVVCLGESMVTFAPSRPGRLADVPSFHRGIGGAESNVACALASLGHRARWISRVGADGFGQHLLTEVAARGVDVSAVVRDPNRPTGVYFRTAGERPVADGAPGSDVPRGAVPQSPAPGPGAAREPEATGRADRAGISDDAGGVDAETASAAGSAAEPLSEVVYYRAGSAASAMAPDSFPRSELWSGRVLHLTGITAALSADCLALLRDLTTPRPGRPLLSFDVNYRVALWRRWLDGTEPDRSDTDGPAVLAELARGCDLVFVGEDEAEAAWEVSGPDAVRSALPEPDVLVVKQGAVGATAYARRPDGGDDVVFAPALSVDVVAPVGAGDAFAAGYLVGTLRGLSVAERLRHGHVMAAAALTVPGDVGDPPSRAVVDHLAALDADAWGTLRLGPGWTTAAVVDESGRLEAST